MKKQLPHKLRFAVLATDGAIFTISEGALQVFLIKVNIPEFSGRWGLPGGLIHPKEIADESVKRHLKHKGNLQGLYLEQLYTFSRVNRDPRGRVVSVAYLGLARPQQVPGIETGETNTMKWCPANKVPKLAYDHNEIVSIALERLRARVGYTNIMQFLLPKEFTLSELRQAYEIVLGHSLDKRNFQKKVLELTLIESTGHQKRGEAHRPADFYRFTKKEIGIVEII